ncbi:MAG TPA: DUF3078 domain-containing protein [Rhodothermales bacterium]|nr:DUF3078 domain-containing protein [Rhodothermales bacterium]
MLLLFTPLFLTVLAPRLYAQEATPDSLLGVWINQAKVQLAATQSGFQNWQGGGANTMAFSTGLKGKAKQRTEQWQKVYDVRLTFGLLKQDTLDFRKAEDLILLAATFQYKGDGFFKQFRPTVAADVRTQFAYGYNYDKDPFKAGYKVPVKVSAFFAPATISQSLGLTYQPAEWFTKRIGLGTKETVVTIERFRPLYGVDPNQTVRFEAGLEAFTEVDKEIFKNIQVQSKLGLFAAFNMVEQPDALWENLITMKVNGWFNVSFEAVTLYDEDISKQVQLREVLSLNIAVNLL